MEFVFGATGSVIVIFIFLVLKKKNKVKADYLLVAVNLLVASFILSEMAVNWRLSSMTVLFQNGVPLILFPTFVFYLLQFTHDQKRISFGWYLLFLPFLIFSIYGIIDHYVFDSYSSANDIQAHYNSPVLFYQIIFKGSQLTFIAVLIYLLKTLNQFEEQLKEGYSTIETIDVRWLKHFTMIYLLSIVLTFVLFLSQNLGLLPFEVTHVFGIVYALLVLSVFYLNYQGIQHYTLSQLRTASLDFKQNDSIQTTSKEDQPREMSDADAGIEQEILSIIQDRQLYLEPRFSLEDLAQELGKSRYLISKVINSKANRSFYDLINGLRVEHLKKLIDDPQNDQFTILALGLDSGFNSKASLNRTFKNFTGMTPGQYKIQRSQSVE